MRTYYFVVSFIIYGFVSFNNSHATYKPLIIPEGITFGVNMMATDPDEPPFLGPPIEINTIEVERIQSASMTVDISPFTVESISAAANAGEFDIRYSENGSVVTIQAQRISVAPIVGGTQFIEIVVQNNKPIDFGVGFGELKILDAYIAHYTREVVFEVIDNGSWMYTTDISSGFHLKIIGADGNPTFTIYQVFLVGMGRAPNLYEQGIRLEFDEVTESYFVPHYPNPDVLYQTEMVNGCYEPIPEANPLVYLLRLDPPPGSRAPTFFIEVKNTPNKNCGEWEPLPEVVLQWPPESAVLGWETYESRQ